VSRPLALARLRARSGEPDEWLTVEEFCAELKVSPAHLRSVARTAHEYAEAVARYADQLGCLDFAAPMDYMCEPSIVERTGLSVIEHCDRTVQNFLDLRPAR